jgi:hypothetical protein
LAEKGREPVRRESAVSGRPLVWLVACIIVVSFNAADLVLELH